MNAYLEKRRPWATHSSPAFTAFKITGWYIAIAAVYIIISGRIVNSLVIDAKTMATVEIIKGIGFIVVTGILLFMILRRHERVRSRLQSRMLMNNRKEVMALCNATVAHDINNFLMGLVGLVEAIKVQEQEGSLLSSIRHEVEDSIDKITQLSRSLARCVRETDSFCLIDISRQVLNTAALLRKHPDVQKCRLTIDKVSSVLLKTNVAMFEHAMMNLIINAAQATGEGGHIEIVSRQENGVIILEVHDNGPGIPSDQISNVLRAGYTTKTNGSGLGMLSVRAFAASCNGDVSIGHSHLGGAAIRIHIPLSEESEGQSPEVTDR